MYQQALELLNTIPDSVWGFVGGDAVSVVVLLLTNRHNLRQQKQQFAHEARENNRERQMQPRRDGYLPASDALAGAMAALARCQATDGFRARKYALGKLRLSLP